MAEQVKFLKEKLRQVYNLEYKFLALSKILQVSLPSLVPM
jgi:hypothetical protein